MWNNFKTCLLLLLILGVSIGFVSSAYYVTDPNQCPTDYQSQTCSGSDVVCGYSGGVTYCYDPTNIDPPNANRDVSTTNYGCEDTTCDGGYVIDCYYYDGSAPHCDNGNTGFCDRNSTCYNKHVETRCLANNFVDSSCDSDCISGYFECDGSTTDADGCEITTGASCGSGTGTVASGQCYDTNNGNCTSSTRLDCDDSDSDGNTATCNVGNGCEILIGGSCSVGSLSGTYANYCTGASGTCVVDKSYFETGTQTEYQTNASQAFLWGVDYTVGNLINLSWSAGGGFYVNATGAYFNGTLLGEGGAEVDPLWSSNYTAYNSSWSSTYNSTYATWAYNQTTPAINIILGYNYYNSSDFDFNDYYLESNPSNYWNDTSASFNKTYADTLYADISVTGDNSSWNESYANTLYRANSWDNFTGIPHATPSDGDTTHFSLADEIYDWVIGLTYATTSYVDDLVSSVGNWSNDKSDYFTSAEVLGFSYYNSTDFSIADYYLESNPFGFYNSTNPSPDTTCADDGSCTNLTYLDHVNTGEFILTGNITITGTNNATIYNNGTHLIFT